MKTGWRRYVPSWKIVLTVCGIGTLAGICLVGVAYAMTPVPDVNKDAVVQGTTIYWDDKTVMAKIGSSRTIVDFNKISPAMRAAALAAEDRNFYHEAAISPTGIARAVVNNLSGGDTQGGSTITQQYVKNAYLNQERTFTRKFKELFIAIKINKRKPKDEILRDYLNTIYFGRQANGVEAAAQAYFGKRVHASDLTVPQAALLAANIKQPGYYDTRSKYSKTPTGIQEYKDTVARYNFVLDGMVKIGALSQADYSKYANNPPMTIKSSGDLYGGQQGYLISRVRIALHNLKFDDNTIDNGGLKVYTTWDPKLQQQAQEAVERNLKSHRMPSNTRVGLVTVNPNNGEVLAAYGGKDYLKRQLDDAFQATAQIGSSFKPFVLATAVNQGIGLKSKMDASSPAWINTRGDRVAPGPGNGGTRFVNDEGNTNKVVDLVEATAWSYNTVYVLLGYKAGWQKVYELAKEAGLSKNGLDHGNPGEGGFFLGQSDMSPLNLVTGYATIANDGEYITPHSIKYVVDSHGKITRPETERRRAFDADVAHDVQFAMQSVVNRGTAVNARIPGRQVAGKTGTTNDNKSVWFSGFTPKKNGLVTTVGVWRFNDKAKKGEPKGFLPLQNVGTYSRINGGDLPAVIWHDYMAQALKGRSVEQFPPPSYVGETHLYATPRPSPSNTPVCMPGQDPTFDHCRPGKTNPGFCKRFPTFPQCQNQNPDPNPTPTNTCRSPISFGCTTPPANNGNGNGNGGGGTTEGQQRAARPLDE